MQVMKKRHRLQVEQNGMLSQEIPKSVQDDGTALKKQEKEETGILDAYDRRGRLFT